VREHGDEISPQFEIALEQLGDASAGDQYFDAARCANFDEGRQSAALYTEVMDWDRNFIAPRRSYLGRIGLDTDYYSILLQLSDALSE
jgi:hypothetical protein